jgi:hypothetical protein
MADEAHDPAAAAEAPAAAAEAPAFLGNEEWVFPHNHNYRPYLLHLMSFLHNRMNDPYPKGTTFSKEELLSIQPNHIRRWMQNELPLLL